MGKVGRSGECVQAAVGLVLEVLFLERGEYQLAGRWQPDGQAASRLLQGFKVSARELLGSAGGVKGGRTVEH